MTGSLRPDPADMLGQVGRHWGWMLAFGIITVLAGIVALAWPLGRPCLSSRSCSAPSSSSLASTGS
jgi:hypothetical protein